ncbi:MAG: M23 family metallopeptidase [Comamonas sp.]|nr:M23 family metallopeptidase [Comamonas sp.]
MNFRPALTRHAQRLAFLLQHHPKRFSTALAALLLGGTGAAFAVASFNPLADADALQAPAPTQRTVNVPVPSLVGESSLGELMENNQFSLHRTGYTSGNDTIDSLFQRLGVADPEAAAFLRGNDLARQHLLGRGGRRISAITTNEHQLEQLVARWVNDDNSGHFQRLTLERDAQGQWQTTITSAPLTVNTRMAGGIIQSSLFAATDAASIPDAVATQIADIFPEINFRRLYKGDSFTFLYETLEGDDEPLRSGRVLAAQFNNRGKTYEAMWFAEPGKRGSYYAMDGSSLRRAYLHSPVAFTRISSTFSNRLHPIHKTWRKHLGTDFAAPTGTPVRTVGDGVVEFAGWQNGYGNVVFVKHDNTSHVTVYAHLSRIDVRVGQKLDQGDNLGAVGSTGWSTGPHLHFEFRVNGVHQDPQTIIAANADTPMTERMKKNFHSKADQWREQLSYAALIHQASAQ